VFLDEVGELPAELQSKLLRFLEERRFERVGGTATIAVDARMIAATNRELQAEVRAGRFRSDLFFRLNVIGIELPPLRERREDLPALFEHMLAGLAARHGRTKLELSADARRALESYAWPGNLRELANALERAVVLTTGEVVDAERLPDAVLAPPSASMTSDGDAAGPQSLDELERRQVLKVLAESATLDEAATRLGINVTTLWRKRKRYRID
jgi:transcriptional regulator with PAS, ATPase and Fis domain